MTAFHLNNEHQQVGRMADRIEAGETLALVTDAGRPRDIGIVIDD